MVILAEKVYGRRKDLGLSQEEVAKKAGTRQRIISEIENANYATSQGIGEKFYDKLANALEVDRNYLFSENINRKTFEFFVYLSSRLGYMNKMQWMKLPYFIDYKFFQKFGSQITNLKYYRYTFGPFDKKMYEYQGLNCPKKITYTYLEPDLGFIDSEIKKLPSDNGEKLKELSYKTAPMKALGATLGGRENMNALLDLSIS
jgi:transcriptional regulator with XRE-family HTH domain